MLAEYLEVLCFDQRGLGQSDVPRGPYSIAGYGDDAAALLDTIGWDECMVVGVSFGGMVAQELALRHPASVQPPGARVHVHGGYGRTSYPLHELLDLDPGQQASQRMPLLDTRLGHGVAGRGSHMVRLITTAWANGAGTTPNPRPGWPPAPGTRSHHDTASRLGAIACPTLVCGGRTDGIAPPANSEFLASHIPACPAGALRRRPPLLHAGRQALPTIVESSQPRTERASSFLAP